MKTLETKIASVSLQRRNNGTVEEVEIIDDDGRLRIALADVGSQNLNVVVRGKLPEDPVDTNVRHHTDGLHIDIRCGQKREVLIIHLIT